MKLSFRNILFVLACLPFADRVSAQRPNILWITIEDTSPHFIGAYGNQHARTPEIDRLAAEGVRFTNAYSTGTVCSPSRSTIITGVRTYAAGTGHHRSDYPVPSFIKGFPFYLRQQGYYVTNNSKTDYNVSSEKRFTSEAWDESSAKAGWWKRNRGQPFFSVFNFMDAHQSRTMTHHYDWYVEHVLEQIPEESRIGVNDFPMPPFYRDSEEMRTQVARVYNSLKLTDKKIGTLLKQLAADGLMDSTIIFLYGDHGQGIPRGKTNGIGLGYRIPFVIWFPKMYRHLSPWGTGVVSDELISFEDLAPTMISLAGGEVPHHMKGRVLLGSERDAPATKLFLSSDRSDNGIDMVRTVTNGRYFYSRNYMPFMPEVRYIRYMEIGAIKQIMRNDLAAGKLNDVQRSVFEDRPSEVLYDLMNDPWELHNLVDDPALEPLLNEMRAALENNALNSRDVMFLPEYEISRISSKTTPYEFRQDKAQYPLDEIYRAASLSGLRGDDVAAKQIAMLQHENRIVRFWAGVGLRAQEDAVLARYRKSLLKAMGDDYPPVSITAASICYDVFGDERALEQLIMHSQHSDPHLALLTINYLLYVRQPQPFAPTIKKLLAREGLTYNVSAAAKDFLGRLGLIPNDYDNR